MLSVLRSQLREGEMVLEFDYRNLVPLYAEEEMKICTRRNPEDEQKIDVWIEGVGGGYAVKGSATTGTDYEITTKSLRQTPDSGEWLKHRGNELSVEGRRNEKEQMEKDVKPPGGQPQPEGPPRRSFHLDLGRGINKPGYH